MHGVPLARHVGRGPTAPKSSEAEEIEIKTRWPKCLRPLYGWAGLRGQGPVQKWRDHGLAVTFVVKGEGVFSRPPKSGLRLLGRR